MPKYFLSFLWECFLLFRIVVNINKGSSSITFTLYTRTQANGKLFSFPTLPHDFSATASSILAKKFLFSIQSSVYFISFVFCTINIVNAFIYSAFRRQKRMQKGENYVSWFKVNKSSCLRTWCACMENLFTGKIRLPFFTSRQFFFTFFSCGVLENFLPLPFSPGFFSLSAVKHFVCLGSVLDMMLNYSE